MAKVVYSRGEGRQWHLPSPFGATPSQPHPARRTEFTFSLVDTGHPAMPRTGNFLLRGVGVEGADRHPEGAARGLFW